MKARRILEAAPLLLVAACLDESLDREPETLGVSASASAATCPGGYVDMLDWMTLDADLRQTKRLSSSTSPGTMVYTSVEPNRFWWLKTPQGDTWDVHAFDDSYVYFAQTELGFHSPWACKSPVSQQNWKVARRCAKPGSRLDRIVNTNSSFQIVSSGEVQATSGDQGTIFTLRDLRAQPHGALGVLPTLVLDYQWNCFGGTCDRLEQFFLTQRYGLVGWKYFEGSVLKSESTFDQVEDAAVPSPMSSCQTPPDYRRVSVAWDGTQANGQSLYASIDDAGRFVAYVSVATNLVPDDTNGEYDVFVYDDVVGRTVERVSVATGGAEANGTSYGPVISRDGQGQYVVFQSYATNLVPDDTNGFHDIFVRDRFTGETKLVSVAADGGAANGESFWPSVSRNGCIVAFQSEASNLVPGDTNGASDVFVRDHCNGGPTIRVSVSSAGQEGDSWSQAATIDDEGRFVVYTSNAQNLAPGGGNGVSQTYLYDSLFGATTRVSNALGGGPANGASASSGISTDADARFILVQSEATDIVAGDTNGVADYFVYDRWGVEPPKRVSVGSDGTQAAARSWHGSISADGRFVTFTNDGTDLAPGGVAGGAYLHDAWTGQTLAPRALGGGTPNAGSVTTTAFPSVATHTLNVAGLPLTDRIALVYQSDASNLVPNDTNGTGDVFLRVVRVP